MKTRGITFRPVAPHVTIRVSGKLFQGHLDVPRAIGPVGDGVPICGRCSACRIWKNWTATAITYLIDGENRRFGSDLVSELCSRVDGSRERNAPQPRLLADAPNLAYPPKDHPR